MLASPNACVFIARVSGALFPRFAQNFGAVPLSDPPRNRVRSDTRLEVKGRKKISTSTQLREILYATPKICYYFHLLLHRATTTAVQMAAPVPYILDTPRIDD
jgi:hypothetical protein